MNADVIVVSVEPVDELALDDGGLLLLYDGQVLHLGSLAAAVVGFCAEPRSLMSIAVMLDAEFGAPPQGNLDEATEALVVELEHAGVLRAF